MPLNIIGLGLGSAEDISVRGLNLVKKCDPNLYLEAYTHVLRQELTAPDLKSAWGVSEIVEADRQMVESQSEVILSKAKTEDVAFLVVGDGLCATTHTDLILRARAEGVEVNVVHNASVMNAIAATGLQLYLFGETVSICFFEKSWRPASFLDKVLQNRRSGLHTLCLLDIKTKEPTERGIMTGIDEFLPPRFMSVETCIKQLREVLEKRIKSPRYANQQALDDESVDLESTDDESPESTITAKVVPVISEEERENIEECMLMLQEDNFVGVARLGKVPTADYPEGQRIWSGTLDQLQEEDFGPPLHSFVIPAPELHECEQEYVDHFRSKLKA